MRRINPWPALGVAAATAVVAWVATPEPRPAATPGKAPDSWQLPALSRPPAPATFDALAKSSLWGDVAAPTVSAPLTDPPWRFLGIVRQGADRFVLIKAEGRSEQRLTLSEKLPDGSEIVEIGDDSLCILINGQRRRLAIYKMGSQVL